MEQLDRAQWRTSSHSSGDGSNCVEVAGVWRTSTYSGGNGGGCVEVARHRLGAVAVRDSKDRGGPELGVSERAWTDFIQGIKRGQFRLG